MRTTLTLEPDVAARIERLRSSRDMALKDIVREMTAKPKKREPFQTSVHDGGLLIMDVKPALTMLDEEHDRRKLGF